MRVYKPLRLLILGVLLSIVIPIGSQASAAESQKLFEPCMPGQRYSCIEYIGTVDSQGNAVEAVTVGKPLTIPHVFAGQEFTGNSYEWKTPGIFHENGNERLQINVFYWPAGLPYCYSTTLPCDTGVDEMIVQLDGAWWGNQPKPVDFPEFGSNLQCGTQERPSPCIRGWGINESVEYVIRIRTPQGWALSHTVGEGRNGTTTFKEGPDGSGVLEIKASPARRSVSYAIITPRILNSQSKADATFSALNIYPQGVKSNSSKWLARCDYARGMSIWHNGNLQSYPNWDPSDQTVSLKVEASHLEMDGTQNVGTFSVAMPLTVASCLWGADLSKATQASISATYPELGITELITTTVKISQGTYFLNASGFHYSAPTIKVKVAQSKESTPPTKEAAKPQLQTISCVKGKVAKKVTALKPKCPAGYVVKK